MINLKNRKVELLKLNKANIESELNKNNYNIYDLAAYYISNFQGFNRGIKSDLRSDDHNSSLYTRVQNNKLIITDFGYKTGMDIYSYLNEKYFKGVGRFKDILEIIRKDFRLNNIESANFKASKTSLPIHYNKEIRNTSLPVKIEIKRQKLNGNIYWSKKDISYWKSYGISIKKLESKGIAPLNKFWITNNNTDGIRKEFNVEKELCYVYPFYRSKEGFFMYKIYMPLGFKGNKNFKWVSNVNKKVIQNVGHIPKSGELLIIQSSYKDIMCMEELIPDINAIAPNGEGIWFDDKEWDNLRANWKYIVLFANNDFEKKDNPGLTFARKHSEKYKIPYICTPDNTGSDISDYYKLLGKKNTKVFMAKALENIKLLI
ncbi:MAG: hypothetical protein GY775_16750 [Candidatus Scalindua sp.]|nr:hypothetical protein [Candidatus Scalindua sp.]